MSEIEYSETSLSRDELKGLVEDGFFLSNNRTVSRYTHYFSLNELNREEGVPQSFQDKKMILKDSLMVQGQDLDRGSLEEAFQNLPRQCRPNFGELYEVRDEDTFYTFLDKVAMDHFPRHGLSGRRKDFWIRPVRVVVPRSSERFYLGTKTEITLKDIGKVTLTPYKAELPVEGLVEWIGTLDDPEYAEWPSSKHARDRFSLESMEPSPLVELDDEELAKITIPMKSMAA